jgi:hypothetical protein
MFDITSIILLFGLSNRTIFLSNNALLAFPINFMNNSTSLSLKYSPLGVAAKNISTFDSLLHALSDVNSIFCSMMAF